MVGRTEQFMVVEIIGQFNFWFPFSLLFINIKGLKAKEEMEEQSRKY